MLPSTLNGWQKVPLAAPLLHCCHRLQPTMLGREAHSCCTSASESAFDCWKLRHLSCSGSV
jgi:hypothetical protein